MGLFGQPDITKLKARRDVAGLHRALRYEQDAAVRRDAADALGEIRDDTTAAHLIKALADPDSIVRANAAGSLGRCQHQMARDGLALAFRDPEPLVRCRAVQALGAQYEYAFLYTAESDPDPRVRAAAAATLARNGIAPEDRPRTIGSMEPVMPASPTVRGGFGEPYCSKACLEQGGRYIAAVMLQNQSGVCGICGRKVQASMYGEPTCAAVPYEAKTLFVCTACTAPAQAHLMRHPRCAMCQKVLT